MASVANQGRVNILSLDHDKRTVTETCTLRVGTAANQFVIDRVAEVEDPAANTTITVPDGLYIGQTVMIVTSSNDDSKTVTVSVTHHPTSDPETGTLSTVDQYVLLLWTGTEWATLGGSWTT